MAKKKKLLPKDFEAQLKQGDLEALKAIYATCELDARGGVFKQTALAFAECPDDLARWLVAQGADIHAGDSYGETPLHSRAGHWQGRIGILVELGADVNHDAGGRATPLHRAADSGNVRNVRELLANGAHADARNREGSTPLEYALQRCSNVKIEAMAEIAGMLLDAGTRRSPEMQGFVTRIGETFEFHRSNFNPEFLPATSAALDRLYALFDVPPGAAPRDARRQVADRRQGGTLAGPASGAVGAAGAVERRGGDRSRRGDPHFRAHHQRARRQWRRQLGRRFPQDGRCLPRPCRIGHAAAARGAGRSRRGDGGCEAQGRRSLAFVQAGGRVGGAQPGPGESARAILFALRVEIRSSRARP